MLTIKHILCPVDFSEFSRHAFDRAVAVARSYGSDITILHVLPVPSAVPALPYGPEGPGPFGLESVDRARALAELPRFLETEHALGVRLHYQVAEAPAVHKEVLLQTARAAADLVVMGTHGRSGFNHLILGSIAEKTLRMSAVPVLVVPPRAPDVVPAGRDPFRHVLCAVDFSPDSVGALAYAASLARHAAGRLTLVHAVEPIPVGHDPMVGDGFDMDAYREAVAESAQAQLQRSVDEARTFGCTADSVLARGKPYKEILRVAGELQVDLVVIGTHGRSALDRLVFGSTTEHLVRRATCPVLTVGFGAHMRR